MGAGNRHVVIRTTRQKIEQAIELELGIDDCP